MNEAAAQVDLIERREEVRFAGIGIAAIAVASFIACTLVNLFYFGSSTVSGDEDRFLRSASHLLATGDFRVGGDVAWEMPGTALFFASLLYLFPDAGLSAVRIAQGALQVAA